MIVLILGSRIFLIFGLIVFCRSKNYQSFDLGLDPFLDDDDEINKVLKILDSQIDLMMITDYMDESMILLKVFIPFFNNW